MQHLHTFFFLGIILSLQLKTDPNRDEKKGFNQDGGRFTTAEEPSESDTGKTQENPGLATFADE